ncbi:hypothetical protein E4U58_002114 [Claviceps cyperi]|nr:hypothetical protein E4U58_002114 [Claviceps cyperi]
MDKLELAMKDAEWILELAPRLPDGYLRAGNIACLQKKEEYAWKMYTAGIEANKDMVVDSSPTLQVRLAKNQDPRRRSVQVDDHDAIMSGYGQMVC